MEARYTSIAEVTSTLHHVDIAVQKAGKQEGDSRHFIRISIVPHPNYIFVGVNGLGEDENGVSLRVKPVRTAANQVEIQFEPNP